MADKRAPVRKEVRKATPGIYVPPNEQHPALALPIYGKSNRGIYLSVGTERSFIGAALTRTNALFVIDYDPQAIRLANANRRCGSLLTPLVRTHTV